jgi:hypothetical protein
LGVEVLTLDSPPPAQPGLRSEYQPSPPRIVLYGSALVRAPTCGSRVQPSQPRLLRRSRRPPATRCQIEDLHIAHELFHHLQATHRFAPLTLAEEEEAAHAFAEEMLGLPCDSPA